MNAALAALLGAALGFGGALLSPYLTARHARQTKLLEMRRDTYVAAIQHIDKLADNDSASGFRDIANRMIGPLAQLQLLTNDDIAALYVEIRQCLLDIANDLTDSNKHTDSYDRCAVAISAFIAAARAHIGVDDIDR